jgi:hypothetical protein
MNIFVNVPSGKICTRFLFVLSAHKSRAIDILKLEKMIFPFLKLYSSDRLVQKEERRKINKALVRECM